MGTKRPATQTDAAKKSKKTERTRAEVKDLDTKKDPKGGNAIRNIKA